MTPTDLSVAELALTTGLAIDQTWNCATGVARDARVALWSAPEWRAEELLSVPPSSLPAASAVRVERRTAEAVWDAQWPLALDLHWLREATPGFPLGIRPVRVHPEFAVASTVRLRGDFTSIVWRETNGHTRVNLTGRPDETWAVVVEAGREPSARPPMAMGEVLRALTGSTSVEWLRGVFADSCSLRWKELAEKIGARPDQFDDLATYFRGLTTTEEDAIWRAAETEQALEQLRVWLGPLATGQIDAFRELLRDESEREGLSFWRGATGEWLNAVAGGAQAHLDSLEVALRLAEPARKVLSLLIREDLARMLVRLHAEADAEWTAGAPWYRRRIQESCGVLCVEGASDDVLREVSPWIRNLHQRLARESEEAARQMARAALSASVTDRDSCCEGSLALAQLEFDATPCGDSVVDRILGGDWRPCFESTGSVRLLGGRICSTLGRRMSVEVLLPFLCKKSWTLDRLSLAEAEIRQTGSGQLTLVPAEEAWSRVSAALLLSAVYTSRSESPADDMIHMVHEDRRLLSGNECDAIWLRLAGAYGLPPPPLPAEPCEAILRVEVPWNWAEAWCDAPLKRDAGYLDKFMRLSLAMQEMTRHWLPALYLSSPARFDSPNTLLPLLVYAASQPYVERKSAEFGYSTMSPNMVQRAAASAVARLPGILAPLHNGLQASGRLRAAQLYSPDRAKLIVSAVQRQPRMLAALLAGDTFLLEYCFQVAGMCRELSSIAGRNPAQALRKLSQFSDDIVKACRKGMKMSYADKAYEGLGNIYLLEATRVLAGGCVANGLRISLTVETGGGMRRYDVAA